MKTKRILTLAFCFIIAFTMLFTTSCSSIIGLIQNLVNEEPEDEGASGRENERNELINEIGGVSDTFKGAVSEESYDSATEAAEAYVCEQIAGKDASVTIEDVTPLGELTYTEIEELGVPSEFKEDMIGIEAFEVTYTDYSSGVYLTAAKSTKDTLNENKTVKVYIIRYVDDWRYFSPPPKPNEVINSSYYDYVFNPENYENCTLVSISEVYLEMDYGGETMTMDIDSRSTIKYADGKIYMEQNLVMKADQSLGGNTEQNICAYLETVDGQIKCYIKQGATSEWAIGDITAIGFTSLDQLVPFRDQYLDYSYFTKTGYGFELGKENAAHYMKEVLDQSGLLDYVNNDDLLIDMYAEYFVKDGALSALESTAHVEFSVYGVGAVEDVYCKTTCTDFGTTVVEKPFE